MSHPHTPAVSHPAAPVGRGPGSRAAAQDGSPESLGLWSPSHAAALHPLPGAQPPWAPGTTLLPRLCLSQSYAPGSHLEGPLESSVVRALMAALPLQAQTCGSEQASGQPWASIPVTVKATIRPHPPPPRAVPSLPGHTPGHSPRVRVDLVRALTPTAWPMI